MRAQVIAVAGVATLCATLASQAGEPTPCVNWPDQTSLLAAYPPAALAAHMSGSVVLKCGRTEHDAMIDCQVASERPTGHGFAAAALAVAARSKEAPNAAISPEQRKPRDVTFRFSAEGPCITPNVIDLPWLPAGAKWARYPDFTEVDRARSIAGIGDTAVDGYVVLACKVEVSGHLSNCRVADESPKGDGYGKAALLLAPYMAVRTLTSDGIPLVGETLTVPVLFNAPRKVGHQ